MSRRQPLLEGPLSTTAGILLALIPHALGVRLLAAEEAAGKCDGRKAECEIVKPAGADDDIKIKYWRR